MRRAGGSGPARADSRRPSRAGRAGGRRSPCRTRGRPGGADAHGGDQNQIRQPERRIRPGRRDEGSGGVLPPSRAGQGYARGAGLGEAEGAGRQFIIAPTQDEFHDSFARARREAAGQEHLFAFGPRASDNFIGGDFVPHGDIHGDSTGVAPLGEGEDTPLDGGGMAFPLGGVKGFTGAYQLGTQDISVRYGEAGGRTRRGRGGRGKGHGAPLSNLKQ